MRKHTKIINTISIILLLFLLSSTTVLAYTDQELCDMALQHYSDKKGSTPAHSVIDSAHGNSVTIHLYNTDGDHTTTYDWYTVDRVSGAGTNFMGEPINLTPYAPSTTIDTGSAKSQDVPSSDSTDEADEAEKPEEVDEYANTDANATEKADNSHKDEDNTQGTGSASDALNSTDKELTAMQDDKGGNSLTKNILLAIAAVSALSGIAGAVILKRTKLTNIVLCQNCGATNASHVNFCTQCGKPIESVGAIKRFLQGLKSPNIRKPNW